MEKPSEESTEIGVWDSSYAPSSKLFSNYREVVSDFYMPWILELKSQRPFQARIESLAAAQGRAAKIELSSLWAIRGKYEIARSTMECFSVNLILRGELMVEQSARTNFARPGDVVIHDDSLPTKLRADSPYAALTLLIPKGRYSHIHDVHDHNHAKPALQSWSAGRTWVAAKRIAGVTLGRGGHRVREQF